MVIFIDESEVHKIVDHSSFAVVYVEVEKVMELRKKLVEINKSLSIDSFHWSEWYERKLKKELKSCPFILITSYLAINN